MAAVLNFPVCFGTKSDGKSCARLRVGKKGGSVMENEIMDLEQLATYLKRDVREVSKMANRGHLPGQKIGGQWRFASAEINRWLESQLASYSEQELSVLERQAGTGVAADEPVLTALLSEATIAVPLPARTRTSVLRELVTLAEQSWQVYDPQALLNAVMQREEMGSTALHSSVAVPHPHRPVSDRVQGESLVAYGRIPGGLPFGAPDGTLTEFFFLVACCDTRTHLQVLARLSRLILRPDLLEALRTADSAQESYRVLREAEQELLGD
jgi:PTS system nitrogen regulatory IIA component